MAEFSEAWCRDEFGGGYNFDRCVGVIDGGYWVGATGFAAGCGAGFSAEPECGLAVGGGLLCVGGAGGVADEYGGAEWV